MKTTKHLYERRKRRVRTRLKKLSTGRPRLSVFRSNCHIYAQVIDDAKGVTLAAASSLAQSLKGKLNKGGADRSTQLPRTASFTCASLDEFGDVSGGVSRGAVMV